MKPKILVEGPILSCSGYGVQSRVLLRALRYLDKYDVYTIILPWGQTSWVAFDDDERNYIDNLVNKTQLYIQNGGKQFDLHIHVGILSEFERRIRFTNI